MRSDILFKKDEVEEILYKLVDESNKLKNIHKDIEDKCKLLNGDLSWKGKGQESFNKSYISIASNFSVIDDNLEDCNRFLRGTIMDYVREENSINKSLDNNSSVLNIN